MNVLKGFCLTLAIVACGTFAVAQTTTDNMDGTYGIVVQDDFSGDAAPGWSAWSESSGWGSGNLLVKESTIVRTGDAQEVDMDHGSGGVVKVFSATPGMYVTISVWIRATNEAGTGQAVNGSQWVEYGYDLNASTTNPSNVIWDDSPKFDFANNFAAYKQYTMPSVKVLQASGSSISVWLKSGAAAPTGGHHYFDDVTIEFSSTPPSPPTTGDFPDDFEGTYDFGVAPGWIATSLPGGTDITRAETDGVTGSAQRISTADANLGVVKRFNVGVNKIIALRCSIRTANSAGGPPNAGNGDIRIGLDQTGQYLNMGASTIEWDSGPGEEPFLTNASGVYTEFTTTPFLVTSSPISVWLNVEGAFLSSGTRADFDDLSVVELGEISYTGDVWSLYR